MKLTEKEIAGEAVEIDVAKDGRFSISYPGEEGATIAIGYSLDEVEKKASAAIRKARVKVDVPFRTRLGEVGSAYGVHAGTRAILIEIDGEKTTTSSYRPDVFRADIPEETLAEYAHAAEEIREAAKVQKAIEDEWDFNLGHAVEEAIEEARYEEEQERKIAEAEVAAAEEVR